MSDIQIDGLEALLKGFDAYADNAKSAMAGGLRAGEKVFYNLAKARVPVKTGTLSASIRIRSHVDGDHLSASLIAGGKSAPHAHLVEYGTAAHHIAPKGKALAFNGIAVHGVNHPGARKVPFMRPAADTGSAAALQATSDYVTEHLKK